MGRTMADRGAAKGNPGSQPSRLPQALKGDRTMASAQRALKLNVRRDNGMRLVDMEQVTM